MSDLIHVTPSGLYCPAGDFYIDPWRSVPRAVITHAHADHATWGCGHYLGSARGEDVLRIRVGEKSSIESLPFGTSIKLGDVQVALHPAGHILGSAQVSVTSKSERWVVSGDYKLTPDPTCDPFEPVPCDVFISEATFALPVFRWPSTDEVAGEINSWWQANRDAGKTSLVGAYALGKAQRLLAALDPSIGPILVHGAINRFLPVYAAAGIQLPDAHHATVEAAKEHAGRALVVAPPSALASTWAKKFEPAERAFASGWMLVRGTRRRRSVGKGFVLSDHADWPDLLRAIDASGASRIGLTHGATGPLERWLKESGRDAFTIPTRFFGEGDHEESAESPEAVS